MSEIRRYFIQARASHVPLDVLGVHVVKASDHLAALSAARASDAEIIRRLEAAIRVAIQATEESAPLLNIGLYLRRIGDGLRAVLSPLSPPVSELERYPHDNCVSSLKTDHWIEVEGRSPRVFLVWFGNGKIGPVFDSLRLAMLECERHQAKARGGA